VNETHDQKLLSWVEPANDPHADFPIQNLPFGVFDRGDGPRIGTAIGDQILDLCASAERGDLSGIDELTRDACTRPRLNTLMSLGRAASTALRRKCAELLDAGALRRPELLVPMAAAKMLLPADIGDYTDFYASIHHATNVGRMFRPDNPLLPNYKYVPIGYHGRASSVVPSRQPVIRPVGQIRPDPNEPPESAPTRALDYELEVGAFVGTGNYLGQRIPIANAANHIFGLCLVNDWSARDIQSWEYQPLGPFLAKSFATTISPWVVTADALEPFRVPPPPRHDGDPALLPYLRDDADQEAGAFDIVLEVLLNGSRITRTRFGASMYWTLAQLVTHHASNGCNLRPGDLIASGTVSGPGEAEQGCLLELTQRGAWPLKLPNGEERKFLQDGDEVVFRGFCEREGYRRIGFGECRGAVRSANSSEERPTLSIPRPTV
jgi:fumarylacetoacetase